MEETGTPHDNAGEDAFEYPEDVQRVRLGSREFILVGTAHVSRESTELVATPSFMESAPKALGTEDPATIPVRLTSGNTLAPTWRQHSSNPLGTHVLHMSGIVGI